MDHPSSSESEYEEDFPRFPPGLSCKKRNLQLPDLFQIAAKCAFKRGIPNAEFTELRYFVYLFEVLFECARHAKNLDRCIPALRAK